MVSLMDILNWYTLISFIWLYFCLIFSDITEKDGETYFPHPILLPDSRTLPYLFFQLGAILALLFVWNIRTPKITRRFRNNQEVTFEKYNWMTDKLIKIGNLINQPRL